MSARARVNLRLLLVSGVLLALVGAGMYALHRYRKQRGLEEALVAGRAAAQREAWGDAARYFARYLGARPEDPTVLREFATARLNTQPLGVECYQDAIDALRRLLRVNTGDAELFATLANLYRSTGNAAELVYIAERWREAAPDDVRAAASHAIGTAWLGKPAEAYEALQAEVRRIEALGKRGLDRLASLVLLAELAAVRERTPPDATIEWLSRAVREYPDSSAGYVRRAAALRLRAGVLDAVDAAGTRAAIREDLERAERCAFRPPDDGLLLAEEWLAYGEPARALAIWEAADAAPPTERPRIYVDPLDWEVTKLVVLGRIALRSGQFDNAVIRAEALLPRLTFARQRVTLIPAVAPLFIAAGKLEPARGLLAEYEQAMQRASAGWTPDDEFLFLQALLAYAEARPYRVIELLERSATAGAASPAAVRLYGEALQFTGQHARAAALYGAAPLDQAEDATAARQRVRARLRSGAWPLALEEATQLEQRFPNDFELKLLRIHAAAATAAEGEAEAASAALVALEAELEAMSADAAHGVDAAVLRAELAAYRGDADAAAAVLRAAIERHPDAATAAQRLARLHVQQGRMDEAIRTAQETAQRLPGDAANWSLLADMLARQGKSAEAIAALDSGIQALADPAAQRSLAVQQGVIELTGGARGRGLERLRRLAAEHPDDAEIRTVLLRVPEIAAAEAQARPLIADLKRIEGERGLLWRYFDADLRLRTPDWRTQRKEIEQLLAHCIGEDPSWSAPVLRLADLYEQLGAFDEAERLCRTALGSLADLAVLDRLLQVLERQGRFDDARAILTESSRRFDVDTLAVRRGLIDAAARDTDALLRAAEARLSAPDRSPDDALTLARLTFAASRDAERTLALLAQAESMQADPLRVAALRVSVLQAARRTEEIPPLLEQLVTTLPESLDARALQAAFFRDSGDVERAERLLAELPARFAGRGHAIYGEFLARQGRLDEAISIWNDGLKAQPAETRLERGVIKALLTRRAASDLDLAASMLAALQARMPPDVDLLWMAAALAEARGGGPATLDELLWSAVDARPSGEASHRGLIETAIRGRRFAAARALAIGAARLFPRSAAILLLRARIEASLGEPVLAASLARAAILASPANTDAYDALLALSAERKDAAALEWAERVARSIAARSPSEPSLTRVWIDLLAAIGRVEEAREIGGRFVASAADARGVGVLLALCRLESAQGLHDAADSWLRQAESLGAADLSVVEARLTWLAASGQFDALKSRGEALAADPASAPAALLTVADRLATAASASYAGDALRFYRAALERGAGDIGAWMGLADATYRSGDPAGAIGLYRQILEKSADLPEALNNLAFVLSEQQGASEEAYALARRATQADSGVADYWDTLGAICLGLPARQEEALRHFRSALSLTPDNSPQQARALLHLGRAQATLRDVGARQTLLRAREMDAALKCFDDAARAEIARLLDSGVAPQ